MLNLHQIFDKAFDHRCFIQQLEADVDDLAELVKARKEIRACLRAAIAAATRSSSELGQEVTPKFFPQGSWAYKTLNDPAKCPPQEIDLDDGVYLPMSLLQGAAPSVACDFFFGIAEAAIGVLVKKRGWVLDRSKKTCVRVIIPGRGHIDNPLYAIPDEEFRRLTESAKARGYADFSEALSKSHSDRDSWVWLSSDQVWLAIRGGAWEQSDPRKIHDWFERLKAAYGEQFVRVCRYLKGWRDHHWPEGGPSSILLMVCVSKSFQKHFGRDDLAILATAKMLAAQLLADVYNEDVDPRTQLNNLSPSERNEAAEKARSLHGVLNKAINDITDPVAAVNVLIAQFGSRIPNEPQRIHVSHPAEVVQSTPKKVVPAVAIQRTSAG
jgi:hypothetical protein